MSTSTSAPVREATVADVPDILRLITELAVFAIDKEAGKMTLAELAPGVTLDEVRGKTEADYAVAPGLAG